MTTDEMIKIMFDNMNEMKSDIKEMKSDIAELKKDVAILKDTKDDVHDIKIKLKMA